MRLVSLPAHHCALWVLAVALAAGVALPVRAQTVDPRGLSFREFAESAWLGLLDRRNAQGGRISELGVLQRWHLRIDDKYFIDRLTSAFSLADDYDWHASGNGARWEGGSITKAILATSAEFKATVPLDDWAVQVRFNQVTAPEEVRSPIRFAVSRQLSPSLTARVSSMLDPDKAGTDLEAGVQWLGAGGARASASFVVLDPFNDVIFLKLNATNQPGVDSSLEYERQPLGARFDLDIPLGRSVRIEAYGAWVRPSVILNYAGTDPTQGLRQEEQYGYLAGLLEWRATPRLLLGAFSGTVWASVSRDPIVAGAPVAPFDLGERTTILGGTLVWLPAPRWTIDTWARHGWRPERREWLDPARTDVDFMLRSIHAQTVVTYTTPGGFLADLGISWNYGATPRGDGQVPATGDLKANAFRLRYDLGYRAGNRLRVLVGSAIDIDNETKKGTRSFGGARGKVMLLW